jgi:hypothetical protein
LAIRSAKNPAIVEEQDRFYGPIRDTERYACRRPDQASTAFPWIPASQDQLMSRGNMHFSYEGFTQDGNRRCFLFRGVENLTPTTLYSIEVDMPLLLQSQVAVQDGPMFCLQLLTTASNGGPNCLDRFHKYRIVAEDFRPLLIERERKAAEKALKKPYRPPFRKPSFPSNLYLGKQSE